MRINSSIESVENLGQPYVPTLRKRIGNDLIAVPGARAIIPKPGSNKILLHRRVDFDVWGVPAGSPEVGESIVGCLRREVLEETDLVVISQEPFGYSSNPLEEIVKFPNGDVIHCYSMLFVVELASYDLDKIDRIKIAPESKEVAWHSLDSLPQMISNHRRTVNQYLDYRHTGRFVAD